MGLTHRPTQEKRGSANQPILRPLYALETAISWTLDPGRTGKQWFGGLLSTPPDPPGGDRETGRSCAKVLYETQRSARPCAPPHSRQTTASRPMAHRESHR